MPIMFNSLLVESELDLHDVRLIRHADRSSRKGQTPFELWRDARTSFEVYQSIQSIDSRADFGNASYWASFGATVEGDTAFLGIYKVKFKGVLQTDIAKPHTDGVDKAGTKHHYEVFATQYLSEFCGVLFVDWGLGTRAWVQRAERQNKKILELRRGLQDPAFPGFENFVEPLSRIEALPSRWRDVLHSSRGIYLMTCPRTREQYVGKADGEGGFLGRWLFYASNGHGGNVGLKSREPSDYQVSILEVCGSSATTDQIDAMESRWKLKLQSKEMGLNRN